MAKPKRPGGYPVSPVDRFWENIIPEPNSGCWLWSGGVDLCGYGRFRNHYTRVRSHRFSYELAKGPIPAGLLVLHSCDNPACCNPDHLFLGTVQDNVNDKVSKGRQLRGEQQKNAKLTTEQVLAIRRDKRTEKELGALYGVDDTLIGKIRRRQAWAHL